MKFAPIAKTMRKRHGRFKVGLYRILNMTLTAIPFFNTLMFAKRFALKKVFVLTLPIYLPRSAAVRTFPVMSLTERPTRIIRIAILGTVFTMTAFGGM